jgi:hypothetical protein
MTTTLRGAPTRRRTVVAAIGSVAETVAPRTNATAHGSPMTRCANAATAALVGDEQDRVGQPGAPGQRDHPEHRGEDGEGDELGVGEHGSCPSSLGPGGAGFNARGPSEPESP